MLGTGSPVRIGQSFVITLRLAIVATAPSAPVKRIQVLSLRRSAAGSRVAAFQSSSRSSASTRSCSPTTSRRLSAAFFPIMRSSLPARGVALSQVPKASAYSGFTRSQEPFARSARRWLHSCLETSRARRGSRKRSREKCSRAERPADDPTVKLDFRSSLAHGLTRARVKPRRARAASPPPRSSGRPTRARPRSV
jgi:hypothetical protein